MSDHVVDTNVLLVASAADLRSPFGDTHVPANERKVVLDWLSAFRNGGESLVVDNSFRIYNEYRNKLTDQDFGLHVVHEKMTKSNFRQARVDYQEDGTAIIPDDLAELDRSDRKFLAAALADSGRSSIVNATDTDWLAVEEPCRRHGVVVEQLIGDWLRKEKG